MSISAKKSVFHTWVYTQSYQMKEHEVNEKRKGENRPEIGKLSVGYFKKDTNLAEMLCSFLFYFCATLGVVEYSGMRLISGFPVPLPSSSLVI